MSDEHNFKLMIFQQKKIGDSKGIPKLFPISWSGIFEISRKYGACRGGVDFDLLNGLSVKGRCPRPLDERD